MADCAMDFIVFIFSSLVVEKGIFLVTAYLAVSVDSLIWLTFGSLT
jgi:hypothetical protein